MIRHKIFSQRVRARLISHFIHYRRHYQHAVQTPLDMNPPDRPDQMSVSVREPQSLSSKP